MDQAAEEGSPTQWLLRRTTEEVSLHSINIPPGGLVHILIGSANRDPRKWQNPNTFDLDRPNKTEHLAFGAGPHFRPGAALSRLLADTAFQSIYPHLDRLTLDPTDPVQLRTTQGSYGIARMGLLVAPEQ